MLFLKSLGVFLRFGHAGVLLAARRILGLRLLALDVAAERAHFLVAVLLKVKAVLLAKSKLQQVIVQRLFAHPHFGGRVLKAVAHEVSLPVNTVIEFAPKRNLFYDVGDAALLGSLGGGTCLVNLHSK
jgi:hypothetical protein